MHKVANRSDPGTQQLSLNAITLTVLANCPRANDLRHKNITF
jgi:hypothetical protein